MKANEALTLIKLAATSILITPLENLELWKISPGSNKILLHSVVWRAHIAVPLCSLVISFKISDAKKYKHNFCQRHKLAAYELRVCVGVGESGGNFRNRIWMPLHRKGTLLLTTVLTFHYCLSSSHIYTVI